MRKLNILKSLLDLFYFFSIFAIIGLLIFASMIILDNEEFPLTISSHKIVINDNAGKILMIFILASFTCFVCAIHWFREVVSYFRKRQIFHDNVIVYLNRTGILLIVSMLLQNVSLFFYGIFHKQEIEFGITTGGFDSFLLGSSLGLFFMVLAEVFKIAKKMKEENELTV